MHLSRTSIKLKVSFLICPTFALDDVISRLRHNNQSTDWSINLMILDRFRYLPGMCTRPSEPRPRRSKFCPRRNRDGYLSLNSPAPQLTARVRGHDHPRTWALGHRRRHRRGCVLHWESAATPANHRLRDPSTAAALPSSPWRRRKAAYVHTAYHAADSWGMTVAYLQLLTPRN